MTLAPGIEFPEGALAEIYRKYKIQELMLFGSAARGELRPDSDVDLLVEFMPEAQTSLFEHVGAQRDPEVLIGRKVDLVSKGGLQRRRRRIALAEERAWLKLDANGHHGIGS